MRIQEAVRSTLVGAAVSMNLTHGKYKSVRTEQDRVSQDGRAATATPLTVLKSQDSMAVHRARLARHRDSTDSCTVQIDSDEEGASCTHESCGAFAADEQDTEMGCENHVQWEDRTASANAMPGDEGGNQDAGPTSYTQDNTAHADQPDEQPRSWTNGEAGVSGPEEPPHTSLSLLVQREDSLSLAHRRMSAHGSPHSRHSTGNICKADQRRSRFHFVPADLLPTEAIHQVTGSIKALYHRSMSLNFPHSQRSSRAERGARSSSRQGPLHSLRFPLKRAASDRVIPAEAESMCPKGSAELSDCPEAGCALSERGPARHPHRSSLKTSLSRKSSLQACGLEMEPLHSRRVSVHFE